jgi:hypothetical protein
MDLQRQLLSLDENGKKIKRKDMMPNELGAADEGDIFNSR